MGAVCTTPELQAQANINKQIERKLNKERNDETGNQKLLLLGRILHKNGFSEAEFNEKREIIYSNIVTGMASILRALPQFGYNLESTEREMDARRILSMIEAGKDSQPFTPDIYDSLKAASDALKKRTILNKKIFSFMEQLERIYAPNYRPSVQDILHTRVPTTGVVQVQFTIKGCIFRVYDVGGQRSERRKWIHLFDDVNAIIFISAINEYDQMLAEDRRTNRLTESMDLFAEICNSKWFIKASMILFLNKKDLFIEKIASVPIKVLFKDYNGKKIYMHETCATDTNQVQLVIDSVVDTIIGRNLKGTGME
ncbi:Guanine nucleotide-binding proteinalpha-15 subunit [Toxocara canis]|uniref:Guanine nucleotide-binding proteinalpha-15 subunit n=1 Tax=Toxocara canis TaxID=6265 RepID=A0A0B2VR85_TOXCA|nr:Guanine nucleotide-binding proteinalpha-15 subunit [Toxocara canis]